MLLMAQYSSNKTLQRKITFCLRLQYRNVSVLPLDRCVSRETLEKSLLKSPNAAEDSNPSCKRPTSMVHYTYNLKYRPVRTGRIDFRVRQQTIRNRFGDNSFLHYEPGNRVENWQKITKLRAPRRGSVACSLADRISIVQCG